MRDELDGEYHDARMRAEMAKADYYGRCLAELNLGHPLTLAALDRIATALDRQADAAELAALCAAGCNGTRATRLVIARIESALLCADDRTKAPADV